MKTCSLCKQEKSPAEFHKRKASPDGLAYNCIPCARQLATESNRRRGKMPQRPELDSVRECRVCKKTTSRFEGRRRVCMDCRKSQRNPETLQAYSASAERKAKNAEKQMRRQYRMSRPSPDVQYVYYAAQTIRKVYGGLPHVDHIVPLNGKRVSGLHVAHNLQLLSKADNLSKSNAHE